MKTYFDCYACLLQQALRAARLSEADQAQTYSIMQQTLALLQKTPMDANPSETVYHLYRIVRSVVAIQDPYLAIKKTSTRQAMALYPKLKALVAHSADPLGMAMRISIAGNIIDFGVSDQTADLWETVERVVHQPYAIDDSAALQARLHAASQVLYLADNAGETVFDRVLIEALPVPVTYAVKGLPILNDALMEDALAAGLDTCAALIDNGSQSIGTILPLCSAAFREHFENAPLVIAKGQANYETLHDAGAKVFCLLQVKCPIIALDLDAPLGSIVARQSVAV